MRKRLRSGWHEFFDEEVATWIENWGLTLMGIGFIVGFLFGTGIMLLAKALT